MYTYIYIYTYVLYIYIYIYIEREIDVYDIYIYIYIHRYLFSDCHALLRVIWVALLVQSYPSTTASCVLYGVTRLIRLIEFATLFATFEESVCIYIYIYMHIYI